MSIVHNVPPEGGAPNRPSVSRTLPEVAAQEEVEVEKPASLREIIDEMSFSQEETVVVLERATGRCHRIPEDVFRLAEDPDSPVVSEEDVDDELLPLARKILEDDSGFVPLPSRWEINEYRIMEAFIDSLADETLRNDLDRAIHGKGAFRYFKDRVLDLGIREDWFRFRDAAFRRIAVEWCEENDIPYRED